MKGRLFALALAAALGASLPADAAPSPADEARRTQLFEQAKKLADEGRWGEAAGPLREVVQIRSAPKALMALGVVERELLHLLEARRLLSQAAADARAASLAADEKQALALLADLDPRIPRVELDGAADVPGLTAFVDDAPAEIVEGRFVRVDPGKHTLRLEAPGRPAQRAPVTVELKQTVHVAVERAPEGQPPPPSAAPAPPPAAAGDDGPSTGALVGAILLGGGGAAVGVTGAVLMAMGANAQDDVREKCGGGTEGCPISLKPQAEEGERNIILGDVLVGVGGAAFVGGAIWLSVELATAGGASRELARRGLRVEPGPRGLALRF